MAACPPRSTHPSSSPSIRRQTCPRRARTRRPQKHTGLYLQRIAVWVLPAPGWASPGRAPGSPAPARLPAERSDWGAPHRRRRLVGPGARQAAAAAQIAAEAGQAPAGRRGPGRERAGAAFPGAGALRLPQRARPPGPRQLPPRPRGPPGGTGAVRLVLLLLFLLLPLVLPRAPRGDLAPLLPLRREARLFLLGESESKG